MAAKARSNDSGQKKTYRGKVVLVLKPDGLRILLLMYEVIDFLYFVAFCGKKVSFGLKWGKQVFQGGEDGRVNSVERERENIVLCQM